MIVGIRILDSGPGGEVVEVVEWVLVDVEVVV